MDGADDPGLGPAGGVGRGRSVPVRVELVGACHLRNIRLSLGLPPFPPVSLVRDHPDWRVHDDESGAILSITPLEDNLGTRIGCSLGPWGDYLIEVSEWGTAGDYMRILRGDLHFEAGELKQARAMYRTVEDSGSGASADARQRLTALETGSVPMAEIKALRSAAGAQCAMCHAQ